jgi:hypothetical protein
VGESLQTEAEPNIQFTFLKEPPILEVRTIGTIHASGLPDLIQKSINEGRLHSCILFLFDQREARLQVKLEELWQPPRNLSTFEVSTRTRMALVLRESATKDAHFLEAFNRNRGYNLKVFVNRELAIAWLVESPTKPNPLSSHQL